MVEDYFRIGRPEKAIAVGNQLGKETVQTLLFYSTPVGKSNDDIMDKRLADDAATLFYYLVRTYRNFGRDEDAYRLESLLK